MTATDYPIGTELKSPHGTRWVKVADDHWKARAAFGVLDGWSRYRDHEVYGRVVSAPEGQDMNQTTNEGEN